jgi:hypothetical protein
MGKDVEAGETTPLLKGRPWLEEYEKTPVGGFPGNPGYKNQIWLAFRTAFFACILASCIWIPETKPYVDQGLAKYVPLSVLMIFFTMQPVFGSIIGSATAAILGTFYAVLNIFILRGFFPDGVTPEDGFFSAASITGWLDLMLFNFVFLTMDLRAGMKMFAMGHNTGYLLAFLNPNDMSVWSKNFTINPHGTAVSCLKVTVIACSLTICANLLPVPFRFAMADMKDNAKRMSAYVAKNFISSVDYYKGTKASVMIEKQMESTVHVEDEINNSGASIGGAFFECFDIGTKGTVRHLHEAHKSLMGELLDTTKAMEIAIATEDFGDSHKELMAAIGEACSAVADSTGELLMSVTASAADGDVSDEEKKELEKKEQQVQADLKVLGQDFDKARRSRAPIHQEVLNESFFVFALSVYSRKVVKYSATLRTDPPVGQAFSEMLVASIKGVFTLEGVSDHHSAIALRCWIALMLGFIYGVVLDNYGGAAAVTIVFLQSQRIAPDVDASLKCLQAVAISSVLSAIIYSRSCQTGYGEYLLPFLSFMYWWGMLYVYFSGCSFAQIGCLAAALSPFVLVSRCPDPEDVSGRAGAYPLWVGVRGFIIALFIMSLAEYCSSTDGLAHIAIGKVDDALTGIKEALEATVKDEDPDEKLSPVDKLCGDAKVYSKAAVLEPRFWKARWKAELCEQIAGLAHDMRLDVHFMRQAMTGADGKTKGVFKVLGKLGKTFDSLHGDLISTLDDARIVTNDLLKHEWGEFTGIKRIHSLVGTDELDGWAQAIEDSNKVDGIKFPENPIDTIEDDLICQISIIFLMLNRVNIRVAGIINACVKLS